MGYSSTPPYAFMEWCTITWFVAAYMWGLPEVLHTYKFTHKIILTPVWFFTCLFKSYCSCCLSRNEHSKRYTIHTFRKILLQPPQDGSNVSEYTCSIMACCARTVQCVQIPCEHMIYYVISVFLRMIA